ncbi:MAG: hypothetical protein GKR89_22940 [Candidatus Latescibacteria bacterium]|nr:hypothetical protein [Candidatus Latescibacterota bacterium]
MSAVYFAGFIASNDVIVGLDAGSDYHRGKESLLEKVDLFEPDKWNNRLGGYPHYEGLRPQFFPTQLVALFTSYHRHLGWRYILTVFIAGLAMYGYMRQVGVSRGPALWSGVAYMSAPTFLSFPFAGHYAKMAIIALFPLMCLLVERGMERPRLLYAAGLGVLIALGIYAPHPQMLYHALWGLGFYFLFKLVVSWRRGGAPKQLLAKTGFFSLAVALGLGLGAEGLYPSYNHTRLESKRASAPEAGGKSAEERLAFARSWSLHGEEIGSLVIPEFGGYSNSRQEHYYWGRNAAKLNSEYFGVLVVLLALVAVPDMRRRPLLLYMGGSFVLFLTYCLGGNTPIHGLFYLLVPGVEVLRTPGMAAFLFAFPACVLGGQALERLVGVEDGTVMRRRVVRVGGVLTGLALLVALAPQAMTDAWIGLFYSDIAPAKRQVLAAGYSWLARGGLIVAVVCGVGTGLLFLRTRQQLSIGLLIAGLCALTLVDTWRIDWQFLRYVEPARYSDKRLENSRTVAFLQQADLARVLPLPSYDLLDQPGYHLEGVPLVTGFHDFTMRRYDRILGYMGTVEQLYRAKFSGREVPYSDGQILESLRPLLNLLNGGYVAVPREVELAAPGWPAVWEGERLRLYRNETARPWFYLVPSYRQVESEDEAVEMLVQGRVDLGRTVVLENTPPFTADSTRTAVGDQVQRLVYDLRQGMIKLRTQSDGPRILVASENYHPHWRAYVDGEAVETYRANYLWQGVFVEAGEHEVELRYESAAVQASRTVSLCSLLAVVGIVGWDYRRKRRQRGAEATPG